MFWVYTSLWGGELGCLVDCVLALCVVAWVLIAVSCVCGDFEILVTLPVGILWLGAFGWRSVYVLGGAVPGGLDFPAFWGGWYNIGY